MNKIQQRFEGFLNTPTLWESNTVYDLTQFEIEPQSISFDIAIESKQRLGKYVERFVSHLLLKDDSIQIITENIQISKDKITLGELDCLLLKNQLPIHLEITYKFYLYDAAVGTSFLEHWIGPNRKDSLILKLDKIKEKQFPLLYSTECQSVLKKLNLKINEIQQQAFFKAQLFVPYRQEIEFPELSRRCVYGFYINSKELSNFQKCKFYIPRKLDWIIEPHTQVDWMNFETTKDKIQEFHQKQSAPLCWIKQPNGEIVKMFVVWW